MANIHPSSVVEPGARIAESATVGPFCYVGADVTIGEGTVLMSHVNVHGATDIGRNNKIYANASVGCDPQDKKYAGEKTRLTIGDDNVIRENVTISTGTVQDEGVTRIGSRNLIMANVHIAHDCVLADDIIMSVGAGLAGHVHVDSFAVLGGLAGVHQFVRIGRHVMIGGLSAIRMDVPPFVICAGNPAEPFGLNIVGLRRAGYDLEAINALKLAYAAVYREGLSVRQACDRLDELALADSAHAKDIRAMHEFIAASDRGLVRPKG